MMYKSQFKKLNLMSGFVVQGHILVLLTNNILSHILSLILFYFSSFVILVKELKLVTWQNTGYL